MTMVTLVSLVITHKANGVISDHMMDIMLIEMNSNANGVIMITHERCTYTIIQVITIIL